MINKNDISETFTNTFDVAKSIRIPNVEGSNRILVIAQKPIAGIIRIEGNIDSNTAIATTLAGAGAHTLSAGTLDSFGIHVGAHIVKGAYTVTANVLKFVPATAIAINQDTCITCIGTVDPVAGNTQIGKEIRFAQSDTTGVNPIILGPVEQKTGTSLAGEIIVHNSYAGLAFPQSSTFFVKSSSSNLQKVLTGNIPTINARQSLSVKGGLRIKVIFNKKSTALDPAAFPKNLTSNVFLDVTSVDDTAGTITVRDESGILNGTAATTFSGVLFAQGGFTMTTRLQNLGITAAGGYSTITLKADLVTSTGKLAQVSVMKDRYLPSI